MRSLVAVPVIFCLEQGVEIMWPDVSPYLWWAAAVAIFVLYLAWNYYFWEREQKQDNLQEYEPDLEAIRSFLNEAQKRIDVVLEDPENRRKQIAFSYDLDTKIYPFLKEAFKPSRDQDLKKMIKRGREERDTLSPKFNEPAATKSFLEKLNNKITKEYLNSEFTPPPSFNEFSGDDAVSS